MAKALFIVGFFLILALPVIQMAFSIVKELPVDENRILAPMPAVSRIQDIPKAIESFGSWFDDHFGFRSFLIRAKTQIDFSIFHTSSRVHIGHHGWLFYRRVIDKQKFDEEDYYKENGPKILSNLLNLESALRSRGMFLIVTVNILADRFLQNELPSSFPNFPTPRHIDQFLEELAKKLGPSYLDMTPIMRSVISRRQAFYKTDYHWNEPAAFVAVDAIVQRAAQLVDLPVPQESYSFEVVRKPFIGAIAKEMPLFSYPEENGLFLKEDHVNIPGFDLTFDSNAVFTKTYRSQNTHNDLLPAIAIIGDSFSSNLQKAGVGGHFKATYMARWAWPKLSDYIQKIPSDTRFVLLQFMEVSDYALPLLPDTEDFNLSFRLIEERPIVADTFGTAQGRNDGPY